MRIITEAIIEGSSSQNNTASIGNIGGGYFSYFGTIGVNPIRRFGTFRENNNNNNNSLSSLLLLGFGEDLREGFNLPSEGNVGELNPNIAVLVNALTGANFEINHIKKESNHVKLTEFERIEVEDSNKWLERYNRIVEANK